MLKLTHRFLPVCIGVLTLGGGLLLARPASADTPNVTADGSTLLTINSIDVMRFRVSSGGYTPVQRWAIVEDRIIRATHEFQNVEWKLVDGEPVIYIGPRQIMTITAADATANGESATDLATTWTGNLRQAVDSMHR